MNQIMPADMRQNIANPGLLEKQIMQMFRAANLNFDNSKTLAPVNYFDSQNFNGFSQRTFFDGTTPVTTGATNVNGSVRPQSEHAFIYGMKILFAKDEGTYADQTFIDGLNGSENEIKNGTFQISVNGIVQTAKIPLLMLASSTSNLSQAGGRNNGLFGFDVPFFWPGQQDLRLRMETAANTVVSVNQFVQVQLFGVGLIS